MKETGNALFLILIAVALFAALSYAVTQSGRGGVSVDRERLELAAASMMQYFGSIEQAVNKLRLLGCTEDQITFENTTYRGGPAGPHGPNLVINPLGANANSPTDNSCHVFNASGGAITAEILTDVLTTDALDPGNHAQPGHLWFVVDTIPGIGSSAADVILTVPHVSDAICRAHNKKFGLGGVNGTPINHFWFVSGDQFTGTFTGSMSGGTVSVPSSTNTWCVSDDPSILSERHILFVVMAR